MKVSGQGSRDRRNRWPVERNTEQNGYNRYIIQTWQALHLVISYNHSCAVLELYKQNVSIRQWQYRTW